MRTRRSSLRARSTRLRAGLTQPFVKSQRLCATRLHAILKDLRVLLSRLLFLSRPRECLAHFTSRPRLTVRLIAFLQRRTRFGLLTAA
jgi:hypothetical protein